MTWWRQRAGLAGSIAVVAGGAGGLGEQISLDLADNGVGVAVVDHDSDAVDRLVARLGPARCLGVVGDARDAAVLDTLFASVDQRWERLDILVNVVGGTFKAPFTSSNRRGWDAVIRTNFAYALDTCALAIPRMRAGGRGGSIVNLTTIEAHRAAPNFAVYAGAKAALANFARSLAIELAAEGIRVNNVAPDMTPTARLLASEVASTVHDPAGARIAIPMGRFGDPTEVSSCVVFLASQLASYVTGTTIHPDGGTWASSGWFNWPDDGYLPTPPTAVVDCLRATGSR